MGVVDGLTVKLDDAAAMLELAVEADDESLLADVQAELDDALKSVEDLEFKRMFSGEMDANNCYLDIQAGSGGTEAQDWSEMLLRMYLRWCESHGFKAEVLEVSEGGVAGIKSATIAVKGDYAFGWLRTEIGVHRLVRKSPFDSNNGRHTSFSAVFVSPEIDDNVQIDINPATYVSIPIVQVGQAVSTSIPPTLPCVSRTGPQAWSWRVKTSVHSTPTKIPP